MGDKRKKTAPMFTDHQSYIDYCLKIAKKRLSDYESISEIEKDIDNINLYENIDSLGPPKNIFELDENELNAQDIDRAVHCILEGRLFTEHAAAGEATRLGLGTKYLINIANDLSAGKIAELISKERDSNYAEEEVVSAAGCRPETLLPISLGERHMIQFSFDIYKLAKENGWDPEQVLKKQKMLIILNEQSVECIVREFIGNRFFGFSRKNVMFMVQKAYHGINLGSGTFRYDPSTPRRLHNHGQMVLQQTMDDQIFRISDDGQWVYLKGDAFGTILLTMDDKISYNIEDLSFLSHSIDIPALAFALKMSDKGFKMLMEIVGNDPENPQKGGMAAYDPVLGKNIMIEGFQLNGMGDHEIKYLNKNFNHYLNPQKAWFELKNRGLNMPLAIESDGVYFQPVQGDINFIVKTGFFKRQNLSPIRAWKSPVTTPLAIKHMHRQDHQNGFMDYSEKVLRRMLRN